MRYIIRFLNDSTRKNKPKKISKVYKKWLRYLKNHKLFDEYMFYVHLKFTYNAYPTPKNYKDLEILVSKINCGRIYIGSKTIYVDWYKEFLSYIREYVTWWNFVIRSKYLW